MQLSEYLLRTLLLLVLQSAERIVNHPLVLSLDSVLLELGLTLLLFLKLEVLPVGELSLTITMQVLLVFCHGLFDIFDFSHLIIKLTLDLLKNADALQVLHAFLLDFLEDNAELMSEIDKVFMDLGFLVEGEHSIRVVSDGHDKAETVALVEQTFDLVPVSEEGEHLAE